MASFQVPEQVERFANKRAEAQAELQQLAVREIESLAGQVFNRLSVAVGVELERWLTQLASAMDNTHKELLSRNLHQLGKNAQLSMLAAYRQLVTARESPADRTHYRAGAGRLAGGILLSALSRDDFFEVSGTTLIWGNLDVLNASARQWHRIAAGAGGRGSGISDEVPVKFEDHVLAVIKVMQLQHLQSSICHPVFGLHREAIQDHEPVLVSLVRMSFTHSTGQMLLFVR